MQDRLLPLLNTPILEQGGITLLNQLSAMIQQMQQMQRPQRELLNTRASSRTLTFHFN